MAATSRNLRGGGRIYLRLWLEVDRSPLLLLRAGQSGPASSSHSALPPGSTRVMAMSPAALSAGISSNSYTMQLRLHARPNV